MRRAHISVSSFFFLRLTEVAASPPRFNVFTPETMESFLCQQLRRRKISASFSPHRNTATAASPLLQQVGPPAMARLRFDTGQDWLSHDICRVIIEMHYPKYTERKIEDLVHQATRVSEVIPMKINDMDMFARTRHLIMELLFDTTAKNDHVSCCDVLTDRRDIKHVLTDEMRKYLGPKSAKNTIIGHVSTRSLELSVINDECVDPPVAAG